MPLNDFKANPSIKKNENHLIICQINKITVKKHVNVRELMLTTQWDER